MWPARNARACYHGYHRRASAYLINTLNLSMHSDPGKWASWIFSQSVFFKCICNVWVHATSHASHSCSPLSLHAFVSTFRADGSYQWNNFCLWWNVIDGFKRCGRGTTCLVGQHGHGPRASACCHKCMLDHRQVSKNVLVVRALCLFTASPKILLSDMMMSARSLMWNWEY